MTDAPDCRDCRFCKHSKSLNAPCCVNRKSGPSFGWRTIWVRAMGGSCGPDAKLFQPVSHELDA